MPLKTKFLASRIDPDRGKLCIWLQVQVPITREVEITSVLKFESCKFEDCIFNVTAGKEK
jgi:hypothetical protein